MRRNSIRSAGSGSSGAGPPAWATELGAAVRKRRKQLRLTQKQLAELSSCGPDFLYDLERGKPTLRLGKLVAVLEALGMKLDVRVESQVVGPPSGSGDWLSPGPAK